MKKALLLVLLPLQLLGQNTIRSENYVQQFQDNSKLSKFIDSIMQTRADTFSGILLVADNNKTVYHKAFGYRNFTQQIPLQKDDVFQIASIAKTFTAMMILMLQEKGKLNFDDPVEKHLTIPYQGITIRHLLTHTSGLPDFQNMMEKYADKTKVTDNNDVLLYLNKWAPQVSFEPGSKWEYNNTGYIILASIVEKITGEDFEKVSSKWIFKPLKMRNTRIQPQMNESIHKNFASGHVYVPMTKQYVPASSLSSDVNIYLGKQGPSNVSSTAEDLLKWDRALYKNKLVKASTLQQAFTQYKLLNDSLTNYGFGWRIFSHPQLGKKVLHTGLSMGYRNRFIRYIEQRKTIILLSNNAYQDVDEVVEQIERLLTR